MSEKKWDISLSVYGVVIETAFYAPKGNFQKKTSSLILWSVLKFIHVFEQTVSAFGEIYPASFQVGFYVSGMVFRGKHFFWNCKSFQNFFWTVRKSFRTFGKNFVHGCRNCIWCVQRKFASRLIIWKKLCYFTFALKLWSKNFLSFGANFHCGYENCNIQVKRKLSDTFLETLVFVNLWCSELHILHF